MVPLFSWKITRCLLPGPPQLALGEGRNQRRNPPLSTPSTPVLSKGKARFGPDRWTEAVLGADSGDDRHSADGELTGTLAALPSQRTEGGGGRLLHGRLCGDGKLMERPPTAWPSARINCGIPSSIGFLTTGLGNKGDERSASDHTPRISRVIAIPPSAVRSARTQSIRRASAPGTECRRGRLA